MKEIMRNTLTICLASFIAISACGSKKATTTVPVEEVKTKAEAIAPPADDKKACELPWGTPEKEKENKKYYNYMVGNYKTSDFETAYKYWDLLLTNVPCASKSIYTVGEAIIDDYLAKATDPEMKKKYIADMNRNFAMRQQYFGEEEIVSSRWGRSLYDNDTTQYTKIMQLLDRSIELNGDTTETFVMFAYLNTAFRAYNAKVLNNDDMFNTYNKLTDIVDRNIDVNAEDSVELGKWKALQSQLDVIIDQVGTCEDLIAQYKPRIAENATDLAYLNKVEKSLRAKRCTKEPLYIEVLEKINTLDPTLDVAIRLANYYYGAGNNVTKGNSFMEKAIALETNKSKNSDRYVIMASRAQKSGNAGAARTYIDKALEMNPNNGYAILQKAGIVYRSARASCADAFDKKAASWVAMDYCQKARNADPRVASQASRSYSAYASGAPTEEEKFMRSLVNGNSYTLKCGYSTTVK